MDPRLEEAKLGKRSIYFVDAAHFVLGSFLGNLWCFTRVYVQSGCGRQRLNVLGAINAISKKLETVINTTYITSLEVCQLLKQIRQVHPDTDQPITLVMDNARYQRCKKVQQEAQNLGIELLFLPPYSPNLNLIERLWKFTKKKCLNSRYYSHFDSFRGAIEGFFIDMEKNHQSELQSLLTLNFHITQKPQNSAG